MFKGKIYDTCGCDLMIIENHSGTMGVKQYNMNTTQTFVHHFNNQSGNNLVSSVLKTSGSFATFNTSSLYFNYTLGNDGARIAAATASSEADCRSHQYWAPLYGGRQDRSGAHLLSAQCQAGGAKWHLRPLRRMHVSRRAP